MEWMPIIIAAVAWLTGMASAFAFFRDRKTKPASEPKRRLPPPPPKASDVIYEVEDKIVDIRTGRLDRGRIDRLRKRAEQRRAERGPDPMRD